MFNIKNNREIRQQFLASILISFLNKGFIFAIFHFEGKVSRFIDKFVILIPHLLFERGSFGSSKSSKFEKNLQKVFTLFFKLKETTPFSFNDIVDCLLL